MSDLYKSKIVKIKYEKKKADNLLSKDKYKIKLISRDINV